MDPQLRARMHEEIQIHFDMNRSHLFDRQTEQAIAIIGVVSMRLRCQLVGRVHACRALRGRAEPFSPRTWQQPS
jgi:hypothetical protein